MVKQQTGNGVIFAYMQLFVQLVLGVSGEFIVYPVSFLTAIVKSHLCLYSSGKIQI